MATDIVMLDSSQMATVLKRYVDILTKKEAHLLEQEGFFNREEHFELFLQEVRAEFDSHPKIRACFAHKAGALNCINFLLGQGEHARDPANETRRYELSFMSTVLLRTSSVSGVIVDEPTLLAKLLGFPEQKPVLDEAIVHYWCKVVRHLIGLRSCDRKIVRALPALVAHVADDSAQQLLSETLGTLTGGVSLLPALEGGMNPLAPLIDTLYESARGARNACEVLCAVCLAVSEAQDRGAHAIVWRAIAPALPRFLRAVFSGAAEERAHFEPRIEYCLSFLVELLMLHTRIGCNPASPEGGAPRLLLPHFGALREMMRSEQTFVQLKAAELLTVALVLVDAPDDDALALAIVRAGLLPLSVKLFFQHDVNGGGRQDFLRHVLLRVFCEALACDNAPVHRELLLPTHGGLAAIIVRSSQRPLVSGSVTHTQMALRLVNDACARLPLVRKMCNETPKWRALVCSVVGPAASQLGPDTDSAATDDDATADVENEDPHRSPPPVTAAEAAAAAGRKSALSTKPQRAPLGADFVTQLAHDLRDSRLEDEEEAGPRGGYNAGYLAVAPHTAVSAVSVGAGGDSESLHLGPSSPLFAHNSRQPYVEAEVDPNVLVVDDETFKSSSVPYYDTPKPKLVKRMFYNRSAKAASPFFKSPGAGILSALGQRDGGGLDLVHIEPAAKILSF